MALIKLTESRLRRMIAQERHKLMSESRGSGNKRITESQLRRMIRRELLEMAASEEPATYGMSEMPPSTAAPAAAVPKGGLSYILPKNPGSKQPHVSIVNALTPGDIVVTLHNGGHLRGLLMDLANEGCKLEGSPTGKGPLQCVISPTVPKTKEEKPKTALEQLGTVLYILTTHGFTRGEPVGRRVAQPSSQTGNTHYYAGTKDNPKGPYARADGRQRRFLRTHNR